MISNEKFNQIAQDLEIYHGIFSKLWQMGKPVEDKSIPTAAIRFNREGGFFNFCFNPDFLKTLDDYNLKFVICHEALHVILNHGYRSVFLEKNIANVAMDVVINESLVNNFGFNREYIQNQKTFCWYDTVFSKEDVNSKKVETNKSFEYYYDLLYDKVMDQLSQSTDGEGNIVLPGNMGGNQKSVDSHDGFGMEDQDQIDQKIDDACGTLNPEEQKKLKEVVDKLLDKDTLSSLSRGTCPGGLTKIMNTDKVKSKKKWETIIKKWAQKYLKRNDKNHEQWARINRRFVTISGNMFIPTEMEIDSFEKEKHRIKVLFFLDTSGSCSHLAERFFNAAKSLPEERFDIQLCCFDTSVYETSLKSGKLYGFGGTSFDIIENYVQTYKTTKNNGRYPDAVFVITDGYGNNVYPEIPTKWYWFLSVDYRYCIPKECNVYNLSDFE